MVFITQIIKRNNRKNYYTTQDPLISKGYEIKRRSEEIQNQAHQQGRSQNWGLGEAKFCKFLEVRGGGGGVVAPARPPGVPAQLARPKVLVCV